MENDEPTIRTASKKQKQYRKVRPTELRCIVRVYELSSVEFSARKDFKRKTQKNIFRTFRSFIYTRLSDI